LLGAADSLGGFSLPSGTASNLYSSNLRKFWE
jgi:hypothetical protein